MRAPLPRPPAWWLVAVALLGLAALAPALRVGHYLDDWSQLAMLDGAGWPRRAAWNLYAFAWGPDGAREAVATGAFPWWTDPALRGAALRPLSSLLVAFDARVLGASALAAHVHSLLWWGALVAAAARLFARTLPARAAAVATLLYALSPAHADAVGWQANRCALVAATFALLALVEHLDAAGAGRTRAREAALWCGALLGGDYALAAVPMVLARALLRRDATLADRARATLPALVPTLAYALAHTALGYGWRATTLYADPRVSPAAFVAHAARALPALAHASLGGAPSAPVGATVALVVLALVAYGQAPPRAGGATPTWLLLGALVGSLIPLAALPSPRLLGLVQVGTCVLVAHLIDRALTLGRSGVVEGLAALAALALALGLHVGLATAETRRELRALADDGAGFAASARGAELDGADLAALLDAPDLPWVHDLREVRRRAGLAAPPTYTLTEGARPLWLTRTADDALEVQLGVGLLAHAGAAIYRRLDVPFVVGADIEAGPVTARVLAVDAFGPTRVRFRFDRPLERVQLLHAVGPRLVRVAAPPVGAAIALTPDR